jgi:hypothetical protein
MAISIFVEDVSVLDRVGKQGNAIRGMSTRPYSVPARQLESPVDAYISSVIFACERDHIGSWSGHVNFSEGRREEWGLPGHWLVDVRSSSPTILEIYRRSMAALFTS